jgi:hypothetical protein
VDIKTAKNIYSMLNSKAYLNEEEQSLFDEAEAILDEANMIGEDGEIISE